jgi:C-5 cytosine-specific DNA methylase
MDFIVGGPCQAFSIAGYRKCFEDDWIGLGSLLRWERLKEGK